MSTIPSFPNAAPGGERPIEAAGASGLPAGLRRPTRAELMAAIEACLEEHEDTLLALARAEREQKTTAPKAAIPRPGPAKARR